MNMKNKIAVLVLATLMAAPAFAEHMNHSDQVEWSGDVGLGTVDNKFHFGAGLKAQIPASYDGNDFKFGLRSGFYLGPSDATDFIIPVLATGEYDFHASGNLKPYLGLEMGVSITHVSADHGFVSNTDTDFAFLFVPGINFGEGERYFFELPLGTLASNFAFLPSIGIHF